VGGAGGHRRPRILRRVRACNLRSPRRPHQLSSSIAFVPPGIFCAVSSFGTTKGTLGTALCLTATRVFTAVLQKDFLWGFPQLVGHSCFGGSTGGSTCAAPDRSILAQGPDGGWWQSLPSRPSPRQPPAPPGLAHGRRDLPPSRPPAAAADPAGATAMGGRYDVGIRSRSSLPSSRSSVQQPPAVLASSHTWRRHRRGS